MRLLLALVCTICIIACDVDDPEVEYYCPETDYSERHTLNDTIYYGTWTWRYTILVCNYRLDEINRDTIWPGEYVSWLGSSYPKRTILIGEDLTIITDVDSQVYCIDEWDSYEYNNTVDIRIKGRKLNYNNLLPELYFSHNSGLLDTSIYTLYPAIYEHDLCPFVDEGNYYPTTTDYYIKVY